MASQPVKVHVADVLLAVPASIGVEAAMAVLDEGEPPRRSFRTIIGHPEARVVRAAWQGGAGAGVGAGGGGGGGGGGPRAPGGGGAGRPGGRSSGGRWARRARGRRWGSGGGGGRRPPATPSRCAPWPPGSPSRPPGENAG